MLEAIKKLDKKILILAGIIIFLPIIVIIFLAILKGCSNSSISYEKYEEKMIEATQKYLKAKDMLPTEEGKITSVDLEKLVDAGYIKSSEKLIKDDTCVGSVSARLNGSTVEENNGGYLNYIVNLKCDNYETNTLKKGLMKSLTTTESGLYNVNGNYIFKGEEVDNYITFYGKKYRIISMDSNDVVKLVKVEQEANDTYWDNKYNTEVNDIYGKNIYKDSAILRQLLLDYNEVKKITIEAKKHIVSKDLCVDARDKNNISKENGACSNVLKNQVISLLDVTDFANASLDPECNSISSKTCRNYNYLRNLNLRTWTYVPVSNNTFEVYYLGSSMIKPQEARMYFSYNIVIYIDGNEKIISGNGKETNPFVIK